MSRSPPAAAETNIRVRALESEHKSRLSALLVIPAKAGIQGCSVAPVALGPRFREGDENSQRLGHAVRTTDIITVAGEDSSLRPTLGSSVTTRRSATAASKTVAHRADTAQRQSNSHDWEVYRHPAVLLIDQL